MASSENNEITESQIAELDQLLSDINVVNNNSSEVKYNGDDDCIIKLVKQAALFSQGQFPSFKEDYFHIEDSNK